MRIPSTITIVVTLLVVLFIALLTLGCVASFASGHEYQQTVSAEVAPQLAAILNPPAVEVIQQATTKPQSPQQNLALYYVNQRRASMGLRPYRFDPVLTRMAEREASNMLYRGRMAHIDGVYGPARGAGVGMSSHDRTGQRFNACYVASPRHTIAGAAMRFTQNGKAYYAIYVR